MIKTVVGVDGMMCSMCEAHINDAIRKNFDVKKVKSNRRKKQTEIMSEEKLDHDRIKEVIDQTGYTFLGITEE